MTEAESLSPLEGEPGIPSVAQPKTSSISWKGILAVALLVLSLLTVTAVSVNRALFSSKKGPGAEHQLVADGPAAAAGETRRLDLAPVRSAKAAAPTQPAPLIPAISASSEPVEPIGVRRTGQPPTQSPTAQRMAPEDAPVVLVSSRPGLVATAANGAQTNGQGDRDSAPDGPLDGTRRNLEAYQRQLQKLLDTLTKSAEPNSAAGRGTSSAAAAGVGPSLLGASRGSAGTSAHEAGRGGLFGGALQGSATGQVAASMLNNRSLTLPKGTAFTCALKTKVVSAASGFVGCQVQRNVYSDDGRVLLVERGSHLDGEYRITSVRPGTIRIPVVWTRIRTPNGVTIDIDSPGTGQLGEAGIDGYVDNRWGERIGAAMLLSLIDDSVRLLIHNQTDDLQADTIVLPSTTTSTGKLAEKVLDSTINIPPLVYQNQGGIVGIYVARDVDFSSVYELKAVSR